MCWHLISATPVKYAHASESHLPRGGALGMYTRVSNSLAKSVDPVHNNPATNAFSKVPFVVFENIVSLCTEGQTG